MSRSKLLLVEDDDGLREVLTYYLQVRGHEVRTATNGVEALQEIERRYPDLVISDLEMPVLDGPSWIRCMIQAGQGHAQVPTILMSGSPQLLHAAAAIMTPYTLEKPFSFEALDRMIERASHERQHSTPVTSSASASPHDEPPAFCVASGQSASLQAGRPQSRPQQIGCPHRKLVEHAAPVSGA